MAVTVRIATWNLWWRFGNHEQRAPGIRAALEAVQADVVCLQEVWTEVDEDPDREDGAIAVDDETAASRPSQAGVLATALQAPWWRSAWRRSHEGVAFGNAILSRHPILRSSVLALPRGDHHDEFRSALLVEVEAPAGRVVVATTHLNFLWDHSRVRQAQVESVCRWLQAERAADVPLILTGDMNADPVADEVRMLSGRAAVPVEGLGFHDAWEVAGEGDGATWSRSNTHTPKPPVEPDKRIDYVFCSYPLPRRRGLPVGAQRFGLDADPQAGHPSDHYGVAVDVTL